jgi:putative transposase
LKYRPDFPERFGSIQDARAHCQHFFHWYNNVHRHSGIGLMPPEAMHYGGVKALTQQRTSTLQAAFLANPLRFKGIEPQPPAVPTAAWINPPKETVATTPITLVCSLNS